MSSEKFELMSIGYKIAHQWNLILFTILAITGSVLFSAEVFGWLAYVVGAPVATAIGSDPFTAGVQLLRTSHRFIGIMWGLLLTVYALYVLIFRRVEVLRPLGRPFKEQLREVKAVLSHYMAGRPLNVELDRHNILVSYLFLLLFVAVAMLSVSGVAIVYGDVLGLSTDAVRLMLLLHDLGFALALLFVFLHLFAVTHPSNRPLLNAMFGDGKVDVAWLAKHMPRYVKRRAL